MVNTKNANTFTGIKGAQGLKEIATALKQNGVEIILPNKGDAFDHNFHQAMLEVDSGTKEPGLVVQEIQKGYMMKSRLLRPSLVGVSKKGEKK